MTDLPPSAPADASPGASAAPPATAVEAPASLAANAAVTAPTRRRFTGAILLGLLVAVIALHILVDQFTPYSSEATVQAPVIGVAPNVSGTIVEVSVEDNQVVRANDPLFTIDPERFAAAVAAAEAALADAGQQVGASTAGIGTAEARLSEAQAHLIDTREQYTRTLEMVRRNVLPKAQGDTAKSQLASAEAGVRSAESKLEEMRKRLGATGQDNPQIQGALAQLTRARLDLRDTRVLAPVDGVVTNTVLATGQFASAGHTVATVVDTQRAWIVANLKENMLANVQPGDRAEIVLDAQPGRVIPGRVASIAGGVERAVAAGLQGNLAYVPERRTWLREVDRIPVRIELAEAIDSLPTRVGGRANVIIYTQHAGPMRWVGWAWIRFVAFARFGY